MGRRVSCSVSALGLAAAMVLVPLASGPAEAKKRSAVGGALIGIGTGRAVKAATAEKADDKATEQPDEAKPAPVRALRTQPLDDDETAATETPVGAPNSGVVCIAGC